MRTDRTERLLNLVLCLLGSRRPVTRATIRTVVPGYGDASSDEAFERMFERDKDELRAMGVPIDTVVSAAGEVEGYRIDEASYAMPEVSLTGAELAVLGLAARAWSEAALQPVARDALLKLGVVDGGGRDTDEMRVSMTGRPVAGDSYLPALWDAVRTRTVLRFDYQGRRDNARATRTLEPWGTVRFGGGWYVVGRDRDRAEARAFRLSRIVGQVRSIEGPGAFASAERADVQAIAARWAEQDSVETAEVEVDDAYEGALRLRALAESGGVLRIPFSDVAIFAAEVAELGARARLIAPEFARALVVEGLSAVQRAHEESM